VTPGKRIRTRCLVGWDAEAKCTHTAFVVQTKLNKISNLQVIYKIYAFKSHTYEAPPGAVLII